MSVTHIVLSLLILRLPQDSPKTPLHKKTSLPNLNSGKEAFDVMYSVTLIFS